MIKELIKLSDTLNSMGLHKEADMLYPLIKLSSIKSVWVKKNPQSDQGITLPVFKTEYGWEVGPADWMMTGEREKWYDDSKGKPEVQKLEGIGFVLKNSGDFERFKLHRGSRTHAGNI